MTLQSEMNYLLSLSFLIFHEHKGILYKSKSDAYQQDLKKLFWFWIYLAI